MFGEPKDTVGNCNARMWIADNYGDGSATMRCQLPLGHVGLHTEKFLRGDEGEHEVTVTWPHDERKLCDHGCGRWKHECREDGNEMCLYNHPDHEHESCPWCHPGWKLAILLNPYLLSDRDRRSLALNYCPC
jgi:hypothetical protein